MEEAKNQDENASISNSLSELPNSLKEKISLEEIECFTLDPFNYFQISPTPRTQLSKPHQGLYREQMEKINEVESKFEISASFVDKSHSSTNFFNNRLSKISLNSNDQRNSNSNFLVLQEGLLSLPSKPLKSLTLAIEESQRVG